MDKYQSRKVELYISQKSDMDLESAIKDFPRDSFAILYSPKHCYLARLENNEFILAQLKNNKIELEKVHFDQIYEARVFNNQAELRWLKEDKSGKAVILSENENIKFDDKVSTERHETICQKYLLWGQSTGETKGNWTQFAEARIGAFFVPIANVKNQDYAQFTAVEYLKEFEDGNVAVFDERLTGIEEYKPNGESKNGK